MSPRVSAVILFHDEVDFLEDAVASVARQDFPDIEILLVDGNATTACLDLARALCAADPARRRLLQHPERARIGVSALRSYGLEQARGEYLGFLDADDVWLEGKVAEQAALLDAHGDAVMVYGRTLMWRSWHSGSVEEDYFDDLGLAPDRLVTGGEALAVMIRNEAQSPTTCNVLMRASAVRRTGGCEARFRGMFDDASLYAKLFVAGPVYISSQVWARYRQRPESLTHTLSYLQVARERWRLLSWLHGYLRAVGRPERAVRAVLRRERINAAANLARLRLKALLGSGSGSRARG